MTQEMTAEGRVIDVLHHTRACDMEELMNQCANLTWSQVFLAVDGLSRRGEISLVARGRGLYKVILRQPMDGRPYPPSLPS
jgi:hypothetical protein